MDDFQTPQWVADKMCGMVDFVPATVLEPTPGSGNLVSAVCNHFPDSQVTAPADYFALPDGRYGLVIANPPFTPMQLGYEFLCSFMQRSDNIIILLPWFIFINSGKRARHIIVLLLTGKLDFSLVGAL